MDKKQRNRIRRLTSLVHKMDLQLSKPRYGNGHGKLRQLLVQLSLFLPPVKVIFP